MRPARGDKGDLVFFFCSFNLFSVGEGRRRVFGLPQSLWRQLNKHHHHHQGFLSGARVQFHLPTGVESSIHRYVSKSLLVNVFFSIDFCKFACLFACLRFGYFFGHFAMIFMPIKQCNVFFLWDSNLEP
jgi:hypothetical protein